MTQMLGGARHVGEKEFAAVEKKHKQQHDQSCVSTSEGVNA